MNRVINKDHKVLNIIINKKNIEENKLQFWIWNNIYIYIYIYFGCRKIYIYIQCRCVAQCTVGLKKKKINVCGRRRRLNVGETKKK